MNNVRKLFCIPVLLILIAFQLASCGDSFEEPVPEPEKDTASTLYSAPDGTEISVSGKYFVKTTPSSSGFSSARNNFKGSISKTGTTMTVTVNQYSIDGGKNFLSKNALIDELIINTIGKQNWDALNNEQKTILRNNSEYAGNTNITNLPDSIVLTYFEYPEVNQFVITNSITTSSANPLGATDSNAVVYQKIGTRTVPVELEGMWVSVSNTDIVLLTINFNQMIRRPVNSTTLTTFYVNETDGKLEIGTEPGNFHQVFCESYSIIDGILTFTDGTSETFYPGIEFTKLNPTQLTELKWTNGNISSSGAQQWFKFTASSETQYIHLNFNETLQYAYIQLYNIDGTTLGSEQILQLNNSYISRDLKVGQTYYIRVRQYSGTGTYKISINSSDLGPDWTPPATITPLNPNEWKEGSLLTLNADTDWYSFNITAGNIYNIWWNDSSQGNGTMTQNISVTGYNQDGTIRFSAISSSWNSPRNFTAQYDGIIYLRVIATATAGGTYSITYTENNSRRTPVAFTPPPPQTQLNYNQWIQEQELTFAGEQQWFVFTATAATQYIHFNVSSALYRVQIQLYDIEGIAVGGTQNIYNTSTYLSYSLTTGDTYYIRVSQYPGYLGTYQLLFNNATARPVELPNTTIELTENEWEYGRFNSASDVNWYSFTATAQTQYIHSNSLGIVTIYAQIFDEEGIAVSSDVGLSRGNYFNIALTEGKTYFMRVRYYNSTGFYYILFNKQTTRPSELPAETITLEGKELEENIWEDDEIDAAGEVAWYSLPVLGGKTYYIWFNESGVQGNGMKTLDINLYIYYSDGRSYTSASNAWQSSLNLNIGEDDTLYLRVNAASAAATGTYGIVYNTTGLRPNADFTPPAATQLTVNTWLDEEFTAAGETKWYRLPAAAGTYYIWLNGTSYYGNGFKTLNVNMSGFHSNGNQAFNNTTYAWGTPRIITVTSGNPVYLKVYSASAGSFGIVCSTATTMPGIPGFDPPDVTTLTANTWANGNITSSGQSQWFKFTATETTQYIHFFPNTMGQTYLQVYTSSGSLLGSESTYLYLNSPTNRTLTIGDTYYIRVFSYTGTYMIAFNTGTTPP